MKKISIVVTTILILLMFFSIVYATNLNVTNNKTTNAFFYTDKTEVCVTDTITMNLDLDKINYENFTFKLTSNIKINNFSSDYTESEIYLNENKEEITIEINKSKLKINKLSLYCTIPEELKVGTIITLNAKIEEIIDNNMDLEKVETNNISNEINATVNNTIANNISNEINATVNNTITNNISNITNNNIIIENKVQNTQTVPKTESVEINIKVIEKSNNTSNETLKENTTVQQSSSKNNSSQTSTMSSSSSKSTTETVTYNGSTNNYLSSVLIDGYDITPEFNKTKSTYFLTIDNDITSLSITAKAEDSSSKVYVYGNANLEVGENKILISVTSENGNVRTYRIYATKNS